MDERGSAKHSQWLDDELAREAESLTRGVPTEAVADEIDLEEPPGEEEEPVPGALHGRPDVAPAGPLTPDEIEARSLLAGWLRPSVFPAHRDALLRTAREEGAEPWALDLLASLPTDVEFANVQRVWETAGGERELRTAAPVAEAIVEEVAEEAVAQRTPTAAPAPGAIAEPLPPLPLRLVGLAGGVAATAIRVAVAGVRWVVRRLPV